METIELLEPLDEKPPKEEKNKITKEYCFIVLLTIIVISILIIMALNQK